MSMPTPLPSGGKTSGGLLAALLLVLATLLVYAPVYHHQFVAYDDPDYVTANPYVQGGLTKAGLAWAFGKVHGEKTYWHPLTWVSHMLDCQLFGLKAGLHHVVNLLLHALNAVLLFALLKRLTGAVWRSAVVAGLFALHPLQVDTVAWIAERKNVLSTLFGLLALQAYAGYAEAPKTSRMLLVFVCFGLALLAKPALVVLPGLLLLLDYWPLRRWRWANTGVTDSGKAASPSSYPAVSLGNLFLEKLSLFALALAVSGLTLLAHRGLGISTYEYGLTWSMRLANAVVSYARYLGNIFWPKNLAVLYPHPGMWPAAVVLGCLVLVLVLCGLVAWRARRSPWLAVGWLWFLGALLPTIGLIQVGVQAMADRFVYVPIIGIFIMVVWEAAERLACWRHSKTVLGVAAGLAVMGCLVLSALQVRHWRDSISLFEHAVRVTKNNHVMHGNLGLMYFRAGRRDEAQRQLEEALRIKPNQAEAHYNLALVLEARQALPDAIGHYREAARLLPKEALPQKSLGKALMMAGNFNGAMDAYAAAMQLAPKDPTIPLQLALFLTSQKKPAEALKHYQQAFELAPHWPEVLNNYAWFLATQPDAAFRHGAKAVSLAEQACALTQRRNVLLLGTLAAAYAEAGRFPEAVNTAQEAIALAQATGDKVLSEANQKLLKLYQAGKPCREG